MAKCNKCSQEIIWDNEVRSNLGITKPAQLVNGQYVQHDCPYYKSSGNLVSAPNKTSSSNFTSSNRSPNPNNYTGSMSDYVNKPLQQQQQTDAPLTAQEMKVLLSEIDISDDIDYLRTTVMNLAASISQLQTAFDNFVKDNPAYRAVLDFQARMFPVLNQLEEKSQQQDFVTANKLKQRYKEDYDADIDPEYDKEYKDSIKGKEEEEVV